MNATAHGQQPAAGAASSGVAGAPPKALGNSRFKSTWRSADQKHTWGWAHKLMMRADIWPVADAPPRFGKDAPIPVLSAWAFNRWFVPRLAIPLLLHYAYVRLFACDSLPLSAWGPSSSAAYEQQCSSGMHPLVAFVYYSIAFKLIAIRAIKWWRVLGERFGYLDGDKPRDEIPDDKVASVAGSLLTVSTFRPLAGALLIYTRAAPPPNFADPLALALFVGKLSLQMSAYSIVLDFYFYWYHRAMHEVPWLWRLHKAHHQTKHPNVLLSLFADEIQEFFDVIGVPALTYATLALVPALKPDWYAWFAIQMYIAKIELAGHSGVRLYFTPPNNSPFGLVMPFFNFLTWLDVELIIEDHDLHHRKGWRTSGNYGKQTRIFDRIFGTEIKREESTPPVVDWRMKVDVPW